MKSVRLAKFLGISRSALRFYEKKKFISPLRDDSNERVYSSSDVINILEAIRYTKYGFNLYELPEPQDQPGFDGAITAVTQKLNEAAVFHKNNISSSTILLPLIEEAYNTTASLKRNLGRYWFEHHPVFVCRKFGYFFPDSSSEFISPTESIADWFEYIPYSSIEMFSSFDPVSRKLIEKHWAFLINLDIAATLRLCDTENTVQIPEATYLATVIRVKKSAESLISGLEDVISHAYEEGLPVADAHSVLARMYLHTVEDDVHYYYYKVRIPLTE